MTARTWRARRGLKGSALEDWMLNALVMQEQLHAFEPRGGRETCRACGLTRDATIHGDPA